MNRFRARSFSTFFLSVALLTGCSRSQLPPALQRFNDRLNQETQALVAVFTGRRSPLAKRSPLPQGAITSQNPTPSGAPLSGQVNAELLSEMYRVIFQRLPQDRVLFGSYLDAMNQGASLEGIYNGFTHSSFHRELETSSPAASARARKVFDEELARLESQEQKTAPVPEASASPGAAQPARPPRMPVDAGASVYTLKKVLGDEALRVIAAKKVDRQKLAAWYSRWASELGARGVDFGLALRNRADEAFHRNWALGATDDRIRWEALNRVHRLLNAMNAAEAPSPAPAASPGAVPSAAAGQKNEKRGN